MEFMSFRSVPLLLRSRGLPGVNGVAFVGKYLLNIYDPYIEL